MVDLKLAFGYLTQKIKNIYYYIKELYIEHDLKTQYNSQSELYEEFPEMKEQFEYLSPKTIKPQIFNSEIDEAVPVNKINSNKPNILIMDDFKGMVDLLQNELNNVSVCDVHDKFNVYLAYGEFAGFAARNLIEQGIKIDIAFLDITLGGIIRGEELDGIDIAKLCYKSNPKCIVQFVTGHSLNKRNPQIFEFIKKYESFFNDKMDGTILFKQDDTVHKLFKNIIHKNSNRLLNMEYIFTEYMKKLD